MTAWKFYLQLKCIIFKKVCYKADQILGLRSTFSSKLITRICRAILKFIFCELSKKTIHERSSYIHIFSVTMYLHIYLWKHIVWVTEWKAEYVRAFMNTASIYVFTFKCKWIYRGISAKAPGGGVGFFSTYFRYG